MRDFKIELEPMNYPEDNSFYGYRVNVDGLWLANLIQTCSACPEQYDMLSLLDMSQMAYFRLRFGYFKVVVPDVGGDLLYEKSFAEDFKGQFYTEEERIGILVEAVKKVVEYYRKENEENEENFI